MWLLLSLGIAFVVIGCVSFSYDAMFCVALIRSLPPPREPLLLIPSSPVRAVASFGGTLLSLVGVVLLFCASTTAGFIGLVLGALAALRFLPPMWIRFYYVPFLQDPTTPLQLSRARHLLRRITDVDDSWLLGEEWQQEELRGVAETLGWTGQEAEELAQALVAQTVKTGCARWDVLLGIRKVSQMAQSIGIAHKAILWPSRKRIYELLEGTQEMATGTRKALYWLVQAAITREESDSGTTGVDC